MNLSRNIKKSVSLLSACIIALNLSACSFTKKGVVVEEHSVGDSSKVVNTVNLAAVLHSDSLLTKAKSSNNQNNFEFKNNIKYDYNKNDFAYDMYISEPYYNIEDDSLITIPKLEGKTIYYSVDTITIDDAAEIDWDYDYIDKEKVYSPRHFVNCDSLQEKVSLSELINVFTELNDTAVRDYEFVKTDGMSSTHDVREGALYTYLTFVIRDDEVNEYEVFIVPITRSEGLELPNVYFNPETCGFVFSEDVMLQIVGKNWDGVGKAEEELEKQGYANGSLKDLLSYDVKLAHGSDFGICNRFTSGLRIDDEIDDG